MTKTGLDYAALDAHTIAAELGLDYFGDCSPIPHDGVFCQSANWNTWGYADALEFCSSDGKLFVTLGAINKLEGAELQNALTCSGWTAADDCLDNPHVQIEACMSYWGVEPHESHTFAYVDDYDRNAMKLPLCFDPDGDALPEFWDGANYLTEFQVWEAVEDWLIGLMGE